MSRAEQKRHSRDAIVASAGTLLRKRGIRESSVGDVMKGAGLTVGGFYGHFESKEELFVEAIRAAGDTWRRVVAVAEGPTGRLRTLSVVKHYLSKAHRDNVETGCPLPNTVPEVAREGEPYRSALEGQFESFVHSLAGLLDSGPDGREEALGLIATMYGALSLSRAVAGTPLSDEILLAATKLAERSLDPTNSAPNPGVAR